MKFVLATVGILAVAGLVTGVLPWEVLLMLSLFVVLASAAVTGVGQRNRVRALRRAIFLNDSLIGYHETLSELDRDDAPRSPNA
jgi:hypothetical protein